MKTIYALQPKLLLLSFSFLWILILKAQQNTYGTISAAEPARFDRGGVIQSDLMTLNKINWRTAAYSNEVPFFISKWVNGIVLFDDGLQFKDSLLQFDWIKNEIYFLNNGKPNFFQKNVKAFALFENKTDTSKTYRFRNGYPVIGQLSDKTYFEVIATGDNFQLLKFWSYFEGENLRYNAAFEQVFKKKADWYLYDVKNKKIKYITLKTKSLLGEFSAYTSAIQGFENDKKKYLSEAEAAALVNSVNAQ